LNQEKLEVLENQTQKNQKKWFPNKNKKFKQMLRFFSFNLVKKC